jgi:hypothetical protein
MAPAGGARKRYMHVRFEAIAHRTSHVCMCLIPSDVIVRTTCTLAFVCPPSYCTVVANLRSHANAISTAYLARRRPYMDTPHAQGDCTELMSGIHFACLRGLPSRGSPSGTRWCVHKFKINGATCNMTQLMTQRVTCFQFVCLLLV